MIQSFKPWGQCLRNFVDEQIVYKWLVARNLRPWLEDFHESNGYWVGRASRLTLVCHDLNQILDNSSCRGIDVILANQFHDNLVVASDGSYLWDIYATFPSGNQHLAPDTAHANFEATMMTRLAVDNFIFDRGDIDHLGSYIHTAYLEWSNRLGCQPRN